MKGIMSVIEVMITGIILIAAFLHFFPQYSVRTEWDRALLATQVMDTMNTIDRLGKTYEFATCSTAFNDFTGNLFTPETSGAMIWWKETEDLEGYTEDMRVPYFTQGHKESMVSTSKILEDDFETGLSKWDIVGTNPTSVIQITSDEAHSPTQSVEVYQTDPLAGGETYLSHTFSDQMTGKVIFWFYDNRDDGGPCPFFSGPVDCVEYVMISDGTVSYGIGINQTYNPRRYSWFRDSSWSASPRSRDTRWHNFTFELDSSGIELFVDDALIESAADMTNFNEIRIQSYKTGYPSQANPLPIGSGLYFDDVYVITDYDVYSFTLGLGYPY